VIRRSTSRPASSCSNGARSGTSRSATLHEHPALSRRGAGLLPPNSIDPLANGDLLVSSRNTWTTYLISERTGTVLWRLGGKHSSFSFAACQVCLATRRGTPPGRHDQPVRQRGGTGGGEAIAGARHRPRHRRPHRNPRPPADLSGAWILSDSQGDVQELSNGDDLVAGGRSVWCLSSRAPANSPSTCTSPRQRTATGPSATRGARSRRPRLRCRRHRRRTVSASSGRAGTAPPMSPRGACSQAIRPNRCASSHLHLGRLRDRDQSADGGATRPGPGAVCRRHRALKFARERALRRRHRGVGAAGLIRRRAAADTYDAREPGSPPDLLKPHPAPKASQREPRPQSPIEPTRSPRRAHTGLSQAAAVRQNLVTVLDASDDAITTCSLDGVFVTWNRAPRSSTATAPRRRSGSPSI